MSTGRRNFATRRAHRRWVAAVAALALSGGLAAGCGGASAKPQGSGGVLTNSTSTTAPATTATTATTTTSTTLAPCGAKRDPFDPTASPPPSGSPAIC